MELEKYIPQATVSKLADRPKDSAAELKAKFDEAEKNIGEYINEKLIPELEEMEEYSNIAFRYTGTIASGDEMPVLTTSDAGKVYNILDDRTYEYTCIWEGAVTKTDNYTYIYVSGIYDNIHNVYRVGYDQFVTSKTDKTKTIKVFYDGRDESGDARFKYDYNYEPKILFENKEEVIVTIDTNIKLLRGENIVWTGHFWNKLSCDTDYKVEKDSCYPVQSGAVYNAIKEHSDNKENPHNVTASQIAFDDTSNMPDGTAGKKLVELDEGLEKVNKRIDNYHDEVNSTVVFEYMGNINPNKNMPSLSVDDDGKVYNISEDAAHIPSYIRAPKAGTILDYSTHTILELSDAGKKAVGGLKLGDKIDLYDEDTGEGFYNVTVSYISDKELWFDAYIEADDFRNGMLVTLECAKYIDLKAGDNIVWTGYSWDNLSGSFEVETTDEIEEDNILPVQSGAVFEGLKGKQNISDIIDDLSSTSTTSPLSANQGRVLNESKVDKYYKPLFPTLEIKEEDIANAGDEGITQLVVGDDESSVLETINELYIYMRIPGSKDINSANSPLQIALAASTTESINDNKSIFWGQNMSIAPIDYQYSNNYAVKSVFAKNKTLMYSEFMKSGFSASTYPQQAYATVTIPNTGLKSLVGSKALIIQGKIGNIFKFPKGTTVTVYGR